MSEYRNSSICIPFQCAPVIRQIQFQKCSVSKRFTVNQSTKKQILYLHRNPIAMGHRPIIYRKSILRRFGTISFPETTSCHKHNHRHHRYHHKYCRQQRLIQIQILQRKYQSVFRFGTECTVKFHLFVNRLFLQCFVLILFFVVIYSLTLFLSFFLLFIIISFFFLDHNNLFFQNLTISSSTSSSTISSSASLESTITRILTLSDTDSFSAHLRSPM